MRRIFAILFFVLLYLNSAAQQVDSLSLKLVEAVNDRNYEEVFSLCKQGASFSHGIEYIDSESFFNILNKAWEKEGYELIIVFNELLIQLQDPKEEQYSSLLYDLGYCYIQLRNYNRAIEYYSQLLQILKEVLGEHHPDYATSLHSLGLIYMELGDHEKAEEYYLKSLQIRKEVIGKNHPDYAASLRDLGTLYGDLGDYKKAEIYYLECFQVSKEVYGEHHPNYAASLSDLGLLYRNLGDYENSEKYYLECFQVTKEVYGEHHSNYAATLNNMGALYRNLGDYKKAEEYQLKALQILKEVLGEHHPYYAMSLHSLGLLYMELGDYEKAEEYYLKSLQLRKEAIGEHHPDYAASLRDLGTLYFYLGDYQEAKKYSLECFQITKEVYGEHHPDHAAILNILGLLYGELGDYKKAEEYYLKALQIKKEVLGEKNLGYAAFLSNIGILYGELGDYKKAEEYYLKSLQITKEVIGEHHQDYAASLNNLGTLYEKIGDYKKAEEYYLKALQISTEVIGENHPNTIRYYSNLLFIYTPTNQYSKSAELAQKVFTLKKENVLKQFQFQTEHKRELFWNKYNYNFEVNFPSFCFQYNSEHHETAELAYDNALFTKGLLLNTSSQIQNSILESGDTALIAQWDDLQSVKRRIIFLEQKTLEEQKQMGIDNLYTKAEQLEKQVIANSKEYRNAQDAWKILWNNVRDNLGKNDVAIEFISFDYYNRDHFTDSVMYCALILRKGYKQPIMIPLFEEKEIIQLVNDKPDMVYSDWGNGELLYQKIWQPLCQYIKPNDNVYFAASGLLHQLNIGALPVGNEKTIDNIYHLNRVSSTRSLAMPNEGIQETSATLYGGILYDVNNTDLQAASKQYVLDPDYHASRSIVVDSTTRAGVKYLAGTEREIEEINTLLKQNKLSIQLYTSQSANEESFKALSGKKQNILHIATHGFFWPIEKAKDKDLFRHMQLGNESSLGQYIDPLTRCGLLFAGANTALKGNADSLPSGVDDGILTAKEISLIDLRNADLVVLSACETGKGEITSEGVFGLQRAFKQAGAQTIVMSLWEVSDDATQMFMTLFYQNMMKGLSKQEAFNAAQQSVREQRPEPYYWAAFILLDGK